MPDGWILVESVYCSFVVIRRISNNVLQVGWILGYVTMLQLHSYIYSIAYCKIVSDPFTWLDYVHWWTCLARLSLASVLA